MSTIESLHRGLVEVTNSRDRGEYDSAFAKADELRRTWPSNASLLVQWAELAQLQEVPSYSLDEIKETLQLAVKISDSPVALIELGHFLSAIEDDPRAARFVFDASVKEARRLLVDALIGQAQTLAELGERSAALQCVDELKQLLPTDPHNQIAELLEDMDVLSDGE